MAKLSKAAIAIFCASAGLLLGSTIYGQEQISKYSGISSHTLFDTITGEIALHRREYQYAYDSLFLVAKNTKDVDVAKETWQAASALNSQEAVLKSSKLWNEIDKDAIIPRFSLMGIAVENSDFQTFSELLKETEDYFSKKKEKKTGKWFSDVLRLFTMTTAQADQKLLDALIPYTKKFKDNADVQISYALLLKTAKQGLQACQFALDASKLNSATPQLIAETADICWSVNTKVTENLLKEYLKKHPKEISVRIIYARVLARSGKKQESKKELNTILSKNIKEPNLIYNIGQLALETGQTTTAEKYLNEFVSRILEESENIDINRHEVWLLLGDAALSQGNFEKAAKYYTKLQAGQYATQAAIKASLALEHVGKIKEARLILKNRRENSQIDSEILYSAESEILKKRGDIKEALSVLEEALKQGESTNPNIYFEIAMLYEANGNTKQAKTNLEKVLELNPNHIQANNSLGYLIIEQNGNLEKARRYIEKAYKLSPLDPFILDSMGWLAYKEGKFRTAKEFIQTSIRTFYDEEVAIHLLLVLKALNENTEVEKLIVELKAKGEPSEKLKKTIRTVSDGNL